MRNSIKHLFFIAIALFSSKQHLAQQLSLDWASYYGGPNTRVTAAQYDPINNTVYICGSTKDSLGISTPGSHKPLFGPFYPAASNFEKEDFFIARFDTAGNRLWATYYGGEKRTFVPTLSIDPAGNVYITGLSGALTGIATPNGFYNTSFSNGAGFLAKFNPQGQRIWSSYYAVAPSTIVPPESGVAVSHWRISFDAAANVYLVGSAALTQGISTSGSYQEQKDTSRIPIAALPYANWPLNTDAFLVKFDSTGNRLWGTFYGGENNEWIPSVYAEPGGNVFIAGHTSSGESSDGANTFVSTGAFLDTLNGMGGGYLAKFDANGNRLWGTFVGGNGATFIQNIKGDAYGSIYVYGHTLSSIHIGNAGTHQSTLQGASDAFLMKFNGAGQKIWGTYFGGSGGEGAPNNDQGGSHSFANSTLIVAPENGGIYISGLTTSSNGIATDCTYEASQGIGGYIAKFNSSGQLLMGSYYDAPISDISIDGKGSIYFSSWSNLDSLASSGSFLSTKAQGQQASIFGKFKEIYKCPQDTLHLSQIQDSLVADTGYLQYHWYKNGVLINSGSYHQLGISDSGNYYVTAVGACNCYYISDTINTIGLHIKDWAKAIQLSLSPNPADNYILIQSKGHTKQMTYQITDATGRVHQNGIIQPATPLSETIYIDKFNPGFYILQISDGTGTSSFKLIKN